MKRTFLAAPALLLLLLLCTNTDVMAKKKKWDDAGKKAPFDKSSKTVGVFVGAGAGYSYNYYYGYAPSFAPSFGVLYDQGLVKAGPGTVGIGGIIAANLSHVNYVGGGATYDNFIVGVRGTWHLSILKEKNNKFDPYGGVMLGVRISSYDYTDYYSYHSHIKGHAVNAAKGIFVGAKYNFNRHFGAFAEAGFDAALFKIGLNFNL
jgi:hypothetical protein